MEVGPHGAEDSAARQVEAEGEQFLETIAKGKHFRSGGGQPSGTQTPGDDVSLMQRLDPPPKASIAHKMVKKQAMTTKDESHGPAYNGPARQ